MFFLKLLALEALGKSAVEGKVPESQRLSLMNDVWKVLAKVRNPQVFKNLFLKHFTLKTNDFIKFKQNNKLLTETTFSTFSPVLPLGWSLLQNIFL